MSTIQKAMKGDRGAMVSLYEKNRKNVYAVCRFLLCDDKDAEIAVVQSFKTVWSDVLDGKFAGEEAFSRAVIGKALTVCKAKLEKKDPKSVRFSPDKVYDRTEYEISSEGDVVAGVFAKLPAPARFYLVLRVMYKSAPVMTDAATAKLFAVNTALLSEVFSVEEEKLNRAFAAAGLSAEVLETRISDAACAVPSSETDEKATRGIDALVAPFEKEAKKRKKIGLLGLAAGLLIVAIILSAVVLPPVFKKMFDKTYYADITIEGYGTISLVLYDEIAPITVKNFVSLAESGFYDGLTFHRIMEGFMMQGGDPEGDNSGGNTDEKGNKINIKGEFSANGVENHLSHKRGVISMARGNSYDSASSQFFIMHKDNDGLDGLYAAFGEVIYGIEIVDAICESAEPTDDNGKIKAEEQPVIESIVIRTEQG